MAVLLDRDLPRANIAASEDVRPAVKSALARV